MLSRMIGPVLGASVIAAAVPAAGAERNYPYFELEGTAESFKFYRNWRSYYWREDFTISLRGDDGRTYRVISREPTPWTNLRMGTTYTGLEVDWDKRPRVQVIGVKAIDRIPQEFYDLKLDPKHTVTAFLVRVKADEKSGWKDYFINNWFHRWGEQTDRKMLAHYANDKPNYDIYGYLKGTIAPLDAEGRAILARHEADYNGIIYHARLVKADNPVGYARHLLHLVGRNKKTARYEVFYGDPSKLEKLDQRKPK